MKTVFTFLLIVFVLSLSQAQNLGTHPPDFVLKDLQNMNYKLSDNKGKVILIFFIGYNCSLCAASAPSVKSKILNVYGNEAKFEALVIDTWNGSKAAVQSFKNSTNLDAIFLQKGSSVSSSWGTGYDRLFVIDAEGKIAFRGTRAAQSDANGAANAVNLALNNLTTDIEVLDFNQENSLGQNYPNPVEGTTNIRFSISEASDVKLTLLDITGKVVSVPVNAYYSAGVHELTIDGDELHGGIYLYKLEAGEFIATKRLIVR